MKAEEMGTKEKTAVMGSHMEAPALKAPNVVFPNLKEALAYGGQSRNNSGIGTSDGRRRPLSFSAFVGGTAN